MIIAVLHNIFDTLVSMFCYPSITQNLKQMMVSYGEFNTHGQKLYCTETKKVTWQKSFFLLDCFQRMKFLESLWNINNEDHTYFLYANL